MLDPNIILQQKPMELDNPLDTAQKAQSLKHMMNQNAIGGIQLQQAQREEEEQKALREAYSNNVTTDENGQPVINQKGVMADLYKTAPPLAVQQQAAQSLAQLTQAKTQAELNKIKIENQKFDLENRKEALNIMTKQADRINTLLGSSIDQASYTANRNQAILEKLPGADKTPETYDPNLVRSQLKSTIDGKSQIEHETKQLELQLQSDIFKNTVRHERVGEDLANENAGRQQYNANREAGHRIVDEYLHLPLIKDVFPNIKAEHDKVYALGSKGGLSDYGLLESLLRTYNPGVSVKQGQLASSATSIGIPDRLKIMFQKVDEGGSLSPELRREAISEIDRIYKVQEGAVGDLARTYRGKLQLEGINPERLPDLTAIGGVEGQGSGKRVQSNMSATMEELKEMSSKTGTPLHELVNRARAKGVLVQ